MARATSAMSSGPGSGTRTCPRPSSLTSNSFELISEQRPWPWQWLASMNSDKGAAPLTGSECMHFYMNLSPRQHRTLVRRHAASLRCQLHAAALLRCPRIPKRATATTFSPRMRSAPRLVASAFSPGARSARGRRAGNTAECDSWLWLTAVPAGPPPRRRSPPSLRGRRGRRCERRPTRWPAHRQRRCRGL